MVIYVVVLSALLLIACDGRPRAPLSPSPPTPSAGAPPVPAPPGPMPPRTVTYPLEGVYTLELNIGSGCTAVPATERSRRYTATIEYATGGLYVVTLMDATFLTGPICTAGGGKFAGVGCHQFFASDDGDANFFLENNNDEAHGGHIVERISSGGWLEIIANASGKYGVSSIDATGSGGVWYCPTSSAYPYPCWSFVSCSATDMTLTLIRK